MPSNISLDRYINLFLIYVLSVPIDHDLLLIHGLLDFSFLNIDFLGLNIYILNYDPNEKMVFQKYTF